MGRAEGVAGRVAPPHLDVAEQHGPLHGGGEREADRHIGEQHESERGERACNHIAIVQQAYSKHMATISQSYSNRIANIRKAGVAAALERPLYPTIAI